MYGIESGIESYGIESGERRGGRVDICSIARKRIQSQSRICAVSSNLYRLYCCAYQSVARIQSVHRVYREKKNSKLKNGPGGGGLNQRDVLFVVSNTT